MPSSKSMSGVPNLSLPVFCDVLHLPLIPHVQAGKLADLAVSILTLASRFRGGHDQNPQRGSAIFFITSPRGPCLAA